MFKNLNKIIGFFLLCFQMSLLNAMVTPPEITKSYRDWLKDGNKGTMWNFIQQRMQGPSEVQAELKQSQNQITDLKALVETQEKQLKEQKRQLEQKMQLKPASDEEKQKLTRELQNSKAELEKVQKELESSKVLLSQSETTFATRTGGYDKAVKESQDEVEKLKTELERQKEAFAFERKQFIDKLNEDVRATKELKKRHEIQEKEKEGLQETIRKLIAENKKKVAEYEQQLKELPVDLNVSNRELASLREENNRLREALGVKDFEIQKNKKEASDYFDKLQGLRVEKVKLEKEIKNLKTEPQKTQEEAPISDLIKNFKNPNRFALLLGMDLYKMDLLADVLSAEKVSLEYIFKLKTSKGANIFGYLASLLFSESLRMFIDAAKKNRISLKKYINEKDDWGNTPLHLAFQTFAVGHSEFIDIKRIFENSYMKNTVKMLLDNGADINIKNDNGSTPLDVGRINPVDRQNLIAGLK